MVAALDPVDHARLGHPDDIFVPIEEIEPDVVALGYDQHHDDEAIAAALADRGIDAEVRRASGREMDDDYLLSTGRIIDRILQDRGPDCDWPICHCCGAAPERTVEDCFSDHFDVLSFE